MSVRKWRNGREYKLAGNINTLVIKQDIYDGIYRVGDIVPGFQAPGIPRGVTAEWKDVSSEYEGRYFKVDSKLAVGTQQEEQLPNIAGTEGYYIGTKELCTGVFDGSYGGMDWWKTLTNPELSGPNIRIEFSANKGQVDDSYSGGFRPQNKSVYKNNGVVRPLTTTIKMWKRIK